MVEPGRRHGPFDFRYPARPKLAASGRELRRDRDGPGRLEWSGFLTRFFPNRRRHDFAALAAFEDYRNTLERAASPQRSATRWPALAASPSGALADWEAEGGSPGRGFD